MSAGYERFLILVVGFAELFRLNRNRHAAPDQRPSIAKPCGANIFPDVGRARKRVALPDYDQSHFNRVLCKLGPRAICGTRGCLEVAHYSIQPVQLVRIYLRY